MVSTTHIPIANQAVEPDVEIEGTPVLTGSDGSVLVAGSLQVVGAATETGLSLFGYSASIAGLEPNLTYVVTFKSLREVQSGCVDGPTAAGSFTTS